MKKRLLVLSLISAALSAVFVYVFLHFDMVPHPASLERTAIDHLLQVLFAIAGVVFSVIIVFFVDSVIFFRRRPGDQGYGAPFTGYLALEWAWTIIPLVIVGTLSVYGAVILNAITSTATAQTDIHVDVLAFRYGWQFTYPDYGVRSFDLELPVDREVIFHIESKDVVHSFWVQEFGPKQDAVPGITTELRLTPTKTGQYLVRCSQLCGNGHTFMTAPVAVVPAGDFQTWIQNQEKSTPVPSPAPSTAATLPAGKSVSINLVAQNTAFDLGTINVPAGASVTINFTNRDSIPHNFALYTDGTAQTLIFRGQIITAPATASYTFTAPAKPGTYFFRCDVHPMLMTGSFVVQ